MIVLQYRVIRFNTCLYVYLVKAHDRIRGVHRTRAGTICLGTGYGAGRRILKGELSRFHLLYPEQRQERMFKEAMIECVADSIARRGPI